MHRIASLLVVVVVMIGVAACSEPEPDSAAVDTLTTTPIGCEGAQLLACARASTIGPFVPDEPTKATGTPITIGMINQENTPAGSFPELSMAARAAADFVNDQLGGIDGHPIELEVCNTKFSAEGSTSCAQNLVDAGVPAVLGGIDVFGNGIDILAANGIPFVGGIPVSGQSARSPNSFQWSGGSWGATVAMADYAANTMAADNVAIVYSDFGSITESALAGQKVLEDHGIEVELVPFPILSTDVSTPIQIASASQPDAIFVLVADSSCKAAFDALDALQIETQPFFTGACASRTITDPLDPSKTDDAIFTIEGPIAQTGTDPDNNVYLSVVNEYGEGLDPIGAATVSFHGFMNLYMVLREVGADNLTPAAITAALQAKIDAPSFTGHAYTCDGKQFEGFPATCSPQQILVRMKDRQLAQITDWVDVGAIYSG